MLNPTPELIRATQAGRHPRPTLVRKYRNRARQAVKGRIEFNLDGFELCLSPEEVIADLDFGVGPIAETARSTQEDQPQVGRVA